MTIDVQKIKAELKEIREEIEKVSITALEAKKTYHRKLKNLIDEEKTENDIKPGMFLGPNGTPI